MRTPDADSDPLVEIAGAVADEAPVDWERARRAAPALRGALRQLEWVQRMLAAHREPFRNADRSFPEAPAFVWGSLQVFERLGEGSFGEVYRAHEPTLDREVALKLRRGSLDGAGSRRFVAEARRLARVRHPNVLAVLGADVREGRAGLWTDLVRGRTLDEELRARGRFGAEEAAIVGVELCRALTAVHAAGLVHGDLKATNVMREGRSGEETPGAGRIVLMDFGSVVESGSGAECASPWSAAPEILRGEPARLASDLYSLGVLLYRLVTGRYPIEAAEVAEVRERAARGDRVPLRDRRPDLPGAFVRVVERALAPEPAERYSSAAAFEADLLASLSSTDRAAAGPERKAGRPRRMLLALAVVAAAVLAAVLWLRAWERGDLQAAREPLEAPAADPEREQDPRVGLVGGGGRTTEYAMTEPIPTVEVVFLRSAAGSVETLSHGARLRPGDHLFMEIGNADTAHVYVLNEDDAGNLFVLFPVPGSSTKNPLAPAARHRLPGVRDGVPFDWIVTSSGGRERFVVVAARRPVPALETALARIPPADPGRPATPGELDDTAAGSLRGVGGMGRSDAPSGGSGRLAGLVSELKHLARVRGGLWLAQFEFENPGS